MGPGTRRPPFLEMYRNKEHPASSSRRIRSVTFHPTDSSATLRTLGISPAVGFPQSSRRFPEFGQGFGRHSSILTPTPPSPTRHSPTASRPSPASRAGLAGPIPLRALSIPERPRRWRAPASPSPRDNSSWPSPARRSSPSRPAPDQWPAPPPPAGPDAPGPTLSAPNNRRADARFASAGYTTAPQN